MDETASDTATPITLLCADMAGTTVDDGDAVMESFAAAVDAIGLVGPARDDALHCAIDTMGQSKIEVFRAITGSDESATQANEAFESAYAAIVADGGVAPMPGTVELFDWCRGHGTRVCLTTGFAPVTRDAIVDALGWRDLVDLVLSPADAGRGRPWPDMILTAVIRLGVAGVGNVAVVGDTVNDLWSGHRAGARIVVGVTTGAHDRTRLTQAPHTDVVGSLAELVALLTA